MLDIFTDNWDNPPVLNDGEQKVPLTTFTTISDAIYYVDMALSACDGYPDDYDIDAIANDITDWQDGKLVLTANDDDSFWDVVMNHMK